MTYSSWTRLIRITAYIKQFVRNLKRKIAKIIEIESVSLTVQKLREASEFWLRLIQSSQFSSEWKALNSRTPLPKSSPLRPLNSFIGKDQLIRLGGGLENSALSYDERHPIILPQHRISELLINQAHRSSLHGGTQLTLRILRQNYWIISARRLVRSHIRRYYLCSAFNENFHANHGQFTKPKSKSISPLFSYWSGLRWSHESHLVCGSWTKSDKTLRRSVRVSRH